MDACPTGALVEPYRLDARRCISYLTIELREHVPPEFREAIGQRLFGCDTCQEVCPWNASTPTAREEGFRPSPGINPVEPAELFTLDEDAFQNRFHHSPLRRPRRPGILRNAAIVLGSRPNRAALPALLQGLEDPEPLARAACAWALGRYATLAGEEALRRRLPVETEPQVRTEIDAALQKCT